MSDQTRRLQDIIAFASGLAMTQGEMFIVGIHFEYPLGYVISTTLFVDSAEGRTVQTPPIADLPTAIADFCDLVAITFAERPA